MTKNHLKRLIVPKTWPIQKKGLVFVTRPELGAHSRDVSIPISVLLRQVTGHAKTLKEVKFILTNKGVKVDGKKRTSFKYPVGFFDVVTFEEIKENYRIIFGKNCKLKAIKIDAKEANIKPCKITSKTIIKKGQMQLNLYDGKNICVNDKKYKVGDSVLLDFEKNEIKDHLPLQKGMTVFFTSGKHMATVGKIEDIEDTTLVFTVGGNTYRTRKDYAFVIGKDKAAIKLE